MKKVEINNQKYTVKKTDIAYAMESERRINSCEDFLDVLTVAVRTVDDEKFIYTTSTKEKIDYIYENIVKIIENGIFHFQIVADFFERV